MPEQTETPAPATDLCLTCKHAAHAPGTECIHRVEHNGLRKWHLCLCLNRPHADQRCSPLMECQGGGLDWADIWSLQQGRTLKAFDGEVTPAVLQDNPNRIVGYRSRAFDTMLHCLDHALNGPSCTNVDWRAVTVADVVGDNLRKTCSWPRCGVNVLTAPNTAHPCSGCRYVPCPTCPETHERRVVGARRDLHESLIHLPAWDDDRVRALITALETAVEVRERAAGHTCRNCDGVDPETCVMNPAYVSPPTPCDEFPCEDGGEPCAKHEQEWAHAEGDHSLCEGETTCEGEYPTEALRAAILARAIPGSKRMLEELEGRAGGLAWAALEYHKRRYREGLCRADKVNNEMQAELMRYAEGTERPVLWSLYSKVLQRANNAEARVKVLEAELGIGEPWVCHVCSKENNRRVCAICETDRPDPKDTTP